jgi:hypothetical protein
MPRPAVRARAGGGTRTRDPLFTKQALCQLSYSGAQSMVGQIWLVSFGHGPAAAGTKIGGEIGQGRS